MNDNVLINVIGLKKHYLAGTVKALDGIDLEIDKGEVVVIEENFGIRVTEIIKQ